MGWSWSRVTVFWCLAAVVLHAAPAAADHSCEERLDENCTGFHDGIRAVFYGPLIPHAILSTITVIGSGASLHSGLHRRAWGISATVTGSITTILSTAGLVLGAGDEKVTAVSAVSLAAGVAALTVGAITVALDSQDTRRDRAWYRRVVPYVGAGPDQATLGVALSF